MSIETDFRALLASHAPLVALVGTRVAQNVVAQGAATPFVAYTAQHDYSHTLAGTLTADTCILTVQCWADTSLQADAVADACVAALALAAPDTGATVITRASGYDDTMDLHATVLTVEWWA